MSDEKQSETIVVAQHELREAASEIAEDGSNSADYHLQQAFFAIGDYLHGHSDRKTQQTGSDQNRSEK